MCAARFRPSRPQVSKQKSKELYVSGIRDTRNITHDSTHPSARLSHTESISYIPCNSCHWTALLVLLRAQTTYEYRVRKTKPTGVPLAGRCASTMPACSVPHCGSTPSGRLLVQYVYRYTESTADRVYKASPVAGGGPRVY